jgi:predicted metalloprotease with PDZ domain
MQLLELNDQLGEYFGVTNGAGILVEKVKKGSAAEKAGIKAGDVLLKVGKRTIEDLEDVSKALSKYDEGDRVDVEVLQKGSNKICPLEIEEDRDNFHFKFFRHGSPDDDTFRRSPFEENRFEIPHWENQDNGIEFQDFSPDMRILERNLHNMKKSFKEHQEKLLNSAQQLRDRSV